MQHVNRSEFLATKVYFPPLPEQRRIAAILDQADALRAKRRAALAQLDKMAQAIFVEMFGGSKDWQRVPVSSYVSAFEGGKSIEADTDNNAVGLRVLKVSSVTGNLFRPEESKPLPKNYIPPSTHILRKGDLLFSRANTSTLVGTVAYVETAQPGLVLSDKTWRFIWRNRHDVEPLFIWMLFQTEDVRHEISVRATGTSGSMKNISREKLFGMRTIMPPVTEQTKYVARLSMIQALKKAELHQACQIDSLFASLQHRAFRGEL